GPDRIANAVGARERYGAPSIVVDFGTSTNFDVVSPEGEYAGGVLAPGVEVSMDARFARAARLFKVDYAQPPTVSGKDTAAPRARRPSRRRRSRSACLRAGRRRRRRAARPAAARRGKRRPEPPRAAAARPRRGRRSASARP